MFNTDVYNRLALKYIQECKENLKRKEDKTHIAEDKEDCLIELREHLDKCKMRMPASKFYYSYNDKNTWKYKDHIVKRLQVLEVTEILNPNYKYKKNELRKYL